MFYFLFVLLNNISYDIALFSVVNLVFVDAFWIYPINEKQQKNMALFNAFQAIQIMQIEHQCAAYVIGPY